MLKCTKFNFGWGSAPDPAGGTYSAPPDLLAGFKGPTSKGREGREGKGGEGMAWEGREGLGGKGRKRRGEVGGEGGGREERGRERGKDVEGPGKWSAPGPALALGGHAFGKINMVVVVVVVPYVKT